MNTTTRSQFKTTPGWVPLPNGIKVRHRTESYEGVIDGLTELVSGQERNPDGRTQYRINVGGSTRLLVSEESLDILVDGKHLVMLGREREDYRRLLTERLRTLWSDDRFVRLSKAAKPVATIADAPEAASAETSVTS